MEIAIPKIVRPLRLAEYADELAEAVLYVWVNPPRSFLAQWREIVAVVAEALKANRVEPSHEAMIYGWLAECWSQGPDKWDAADVKKLADHCEDTDPALWSFVQDGMWRLINEHRASARKN